VHDADTFSKDLEGQVRRSEEDVMWGGVCMLMREWVGCYCWQQGHNVYTKKRQLTDNSGQNDQVSIVSIQHHRSRIRPFMNGEVCGLVLAKALFQNLVVIDS
jgi:hypothetical protein